MRRTKDPRGADSIAWLERPVPLTDSGRGPMVLGVCRAAPLGAALFKHWQREARARAVPAVSAAEPMEVSVS